MLHRSKERIPDKTTEQVEFEKNKTYCTFKPMKVAQYKTNSINIADRFEPEAEQIESQQWRPESKPSDPTSTGTLDIPPELRYQEPTVSPIQPTIILDVNIGSPSCKIVPLSIFADSDPS